MGDSLVMQAYKGTLEILSRIPAGKGIPLSDVHNALFVTLGVAKDEAYARHVKILQRLNYLVQVKKATFKAEPIYEIGAEGEKLLRERKQQFVDEPEKKVE